MCIFENCKKRAYYNYETEEKPKFCSEHRLENMINMKSKKCFENCGLWGRLSGRLCKAKPTRLPFRRDLGSDFMY
jgi:hypothetical protein